MKVEIVPAVIAKDFQELQEMVGRVENYARWVQLDIMDGDFVPNTTWSDPEALHDFDPGVFMSAHLMISQPEKYVGRWIYAGVKRVVFHNEATRYPREIIDICRKKKIQVGVAINPDTPLRAINTIDELVDMVLVMGVEPGFGGQEFMPKVLPKIRRLRKAHPKLRIGVDGGMDPKTAPKAVGAGADIIISGSYVFSGEDIRRRIEDIKKAAGII